MTIKYSINTQNLFIGSTVSLIAGTNYPVTLFPGTRPASAQDIITNWATTYFTSYLIHWNGIPWVQQDPNVPGTGNKFYLTNSGAPIIATRTGVATWGILWSSESLAITSTYPSSKPRFIVGDVGIVGSNAMFRVTSTSFTSGSSYSLIDGSLVAVLP
jgi:hypothetical protein